jgi:hypothetical protein
VHSSTTAFRGQMGDPHAAKGKADPEEIHWIDTRLRLEVSEALFLVMFAAHRVPLYQSGWAERAARLVRRAVGVLDEL